MYKTLLNMSFLNISFFRGLKLLLMRNTLFFTKCDNFLLLFNIYTFYRGTDILVETLVKKKIFYFLIHKLFTFPF